MSYILIGCLKKELRALFGNLFLFSTKALKNNKVHVWMVCKVMVLCCLNWAHNFFSFLWFVLGYKWKIEGSCGSRDVYQINRHTLGKVPTFLSHSGGILKQKIKGGTELVVIPEMLFHFAINCIKTTCCNETSLLITSEYLRLIFFAFKDFCFSNLLQKLSQCCCVTLIHLCDFGPNTALRMWYDQWYFE